MLKRLFIVRMIFSLILLPLVPAQAATQPSLQYRATGSTPYLYHATYQLREKDNEKLTGWRKLELSKTLRRQTDPDHPGLLFTQITSTILAEDGSKEKEHLSSQLKADFSQSEAGFTNDSYAVEAIPYLGIPLLVVTDPPISGLMWKASWKIRLEDGHDQTISGEYKIDRLGMMAGHSCAFISYRLFSDAAYGFDNPSQDHWVGQGRFAFDLEAGLLVSHQGQLVRSTESLDSSGTGQGTRRKEISYDMAEVLVH